MMIILAFLICILIFVAVEVWDSHVESKKKREAILNRKPTPVKATPTQMKIILDSLRDLQCVPVERKDNPYRIDFCYQSENYRIDWMENSVYVDILDYTWYDFEAFDVDLFAKAKRVINEINKKYPVNVGYYRDGAKVYVVTTCETICIEEINFTEHLRIILQYCFLAQKEFFRLIESEHDDTK